MGEKRIAYSFDRKREGNRPLGRARRRWKGNIKMNLKEIGYQGLGWINLAQDNHHLRLVKE
jgi:hypothetical protein